MKRVLSLLLGLLLTAMAFASAETTAASDITGSIENGDYTLLIHAAPGDAGWFVETTEDMEAMLNVAEAAYTYEGFFVRLEPVSDGTVTVRILHQDDSEICDQVCTFDLLIRDGAVQESTGGSYTAAPPEEDLDPVLSGEWLEKETQFTRMTVAKNAGKGWTVEISSPITHEAYVFTAHVRYDCDEDAFVYSDGIQYNAPIETAETGVLGEPVYTGETGEFRFAEDGGTLCLVWTNEFSVPRTVTFVRAEADS